MKKQDKILKYIFLDIDGVIATPKTVEHGMWALTPEKQDLLAMILEKTGAKIVLSSSWRKETIEESIEFMNKKGFRFSDKIVGVTIRGYGCLRKGVHLSIPRGVEIKQWLDTHVIWPWYAYPERSPEFSVFNEDGSFKKMRHQKLNIDYKYIILDDDSDMLLEHADHFIRCDSMEGLSPEQANRAIEMLN